MKRLVFYFLKALAFISRAFGAKHIYMRILCLAHKSQGVRFEGNPEYIQADAYLDPSGGLTIHEGVVISTKVIILTHDWSFLKRHNAKNKNAFCPVEIGKNSFIGAGAILLPGTIIKERCIIGAGAVIKGIIPNEAIMVGNPAKNINQISAT